MCKAKKKLLLQGRYSIENRLTDLPVDFRYIVLFIEWDYIIKYKPKHPVYKTRDPWALTDYSLRTSMASY